MTPNRQRVLQELYQSSPASMADLATRLFVTPFDFHLHSALLELEQDELLEIDPHLGLEETEYSITQAGVAAHEAYSRRYIDQAIF